MSKQKSSSPDYPSLGQMVVKASGNDVACKPLPGLYLVATPIGNLGDITLRALTVLAQADIIACEDTRNSGFLLKTFGLHKPTLSYHDHNADARRPELLQRLHHKAVVALVSDAGMPAIADPGFKLVRECRDLGIDVFVIPGANAALSALTGSGLPTDQFFFFGFLPVKTIARQKVLGPFKQLEATLIFYEAPQRVAETLKDLVQTFGRDRRAAVARELTKLFEETKRGTLGELADHYDANDVRGETVILVAGKKNDQEMPDIDTLLEQRLAHLTVRDAVSEVAEMLGAKKKDIYARALTLTENKKP